MKAPRTISQRIANGLTNAQVTRGETVNRRPPKKSLSVSMKPSIPITPPCAPASVPRCRTASIQAIMVALRRRMNGVPPASGNFDKAAPLIGRGCEVTVLRNGNA